MAWREDIDENVQIETGSAAEVLCKVEFSAESW